MTSPPPRWRATIRQDEVGDYDLYLADLVTPKPTATAPASAPATSPAIAPTEPRLAFDEARKVPNINSARRDGPCFVSPAGDFLYFASNRLGGAGGFDLYRCRLVGGECGELNNTSGTVAPGNGPGILHVGGSYTQGTDGTLEIELASALGVSGWDFDQLDVTGNVTLAGTLDLQDVGGYMASAQLGDQAPAM